MSARVLHVSGFPGFGGVETRLLEYLSHIDDCHEHVLCALNPSDEVHERLQQLPVETHEIRRRFRTDPGMALKIAGVLRGRSFDIVYGRGLSGALWGSLGGFLGRVRHTIIGEHGGLGFEPKSLRTIEGILARRSALVIVNSEATKAELMWRSGVGADRIRIVYNGFQERRFSNQSAGNGLRKSLGIPLESPVVGHVGNFHPWKDQQSLVRAMPAVLERLPDAVLVLVGSDLGLNEQQACREIAAGLDIASSIRFTGRREDTPAFYAMFDVFVLPSVYEAFGNVLVEAGLAGTPVIASRVGGVPEIVEDGVTGLTLRPARPLEPAEGRRAAPAQVIDCDTRRATTPMRLDPEQLAGSILSLLEDRPMAMRMAAAARQNAISRFSLRRYVADLSEIYEQLVAGSPVPSSGI